MRTEKDALGTVEIAADALWGIHAQRARGNFQLSSRRVPYSLISAFAVVKKAAAMASAELGYLEKDKADAIGKACDKIADGEKAYADSFVLDALQGGAGTSTNMNVNEVIANLALKIMGHKPGEYDVIHPINHINLHQSTNDAYPTALHVASIAGLRTLGDAFAKLQGSFQAKEKEFASLLKMGRTELQPAVPMTLGQEFSAFAEAVSRDRWRTSKGEERLRMVNMGGTAIGTGITAPRDYIFRVVEVLRSLTGMGLARNENLIDGTANVDCFVEVSGMLKTAASNMAKIAADLRLMHFLGEITLPSLQAGSSIMPGKVNPVVTECTMQTSMVVRANDFIVTECAAHGTLQINEFMPMLAFAFLELIEVLTNAALTLSKHVDGIIGNVEGCASYWENSPMQLTALLPHIGYEKSRLLMKEYEAVKASPDKKLRDFLNEKLGAELTAQVFSADNLVGLGHKAA